MAARGATSRHRIEHYLDRETETDMHASNDTHLSTVPEVHQKAPLGSVSPAAARTGTR